MTTTRLTATLVLLALLGAACSEPGAVGGSAASQTRTVTIASTASKASSAQIASEPLARFSKKNAMNHVRKLASEIGVRVKGTEGERLGMRYAARKFRSYGYEVTIQKFSVDGKTSRNVVASWPDSKTYPFVVGGHMDTVPGAPGANDNASGVAVVLEMARIFAGRDQARWLKFVAFGSEESGQASTHHDGSRAYVNRLGQKGRQRLAGMISVDMVADGRPLLIGHSNIAGKPVVARTVYNKMDKAGFAVRFIILCDCSDHGPFEYAGIPAGFTYSGQEPDYHSPTDTVSNMSPDDLARTGKAVRAFLKHVDKAMLDRFRRS
ncbi:MAG: M20/M25/M40 family metallo-hydrolase [Actinomycetota bacterium]